MWRWFWLRVVVVVVMVHEGFSYLPARAGQSSVPVVLSLCLSTCRMKRFVKHHSLLLITLTLLFPSRWGW